MRNLKNKFISSILLSGFLLINLFNFGCQNLALLNTQTLDLENCNNENLISNCKVVEITTKDAGEARVISKNKIDFMKMHFQNSADPYFGTSTLPEECLKELKWGPTREDSEGFWVLSRLLTDENWNINCNQGSSKSFRILRYCKKNQQIIDVWIKLNSEIKIKNVRCDGKLTYKIVR